jgi:hypothetical protein
MSCARRWRQLPCRPDRTGGYRSGVLVRSGWDCEVRDGGIHDASNRPVGRPHRITERGTKADSDCSVAVGMDLASKDDEAGEVLIEDYRR